MRFIADFHVHSKFSRATSKNLDFENLYIAAQLKGIMVVGTADFTDAHSPLKLGREANLFNTDMSYPKTKCAIKSGDSKQFLGTFEFYPEEGKYHLDGHRKCNVRRWPKETGKQASFF